MKKKHTMPDMKEGNVNVTPLIDVVMCLIIFFMLVAKIGVTTGEDAALHNLVQSRLGTTIHDMGTTFTLNVFKLPGADGLPQISVLVPGTKEVHMVPANEIVTIIKGMRDELKKTNTELKVILRADADTPYSMISAALRIIANAGVKNVDYNTKTAH